MFAVIRIGRGAQYLLLGCVIAVLGISLFFNVSRLHRFQELAAEPGRVSLRVASLAERDYLRLRAALADLLADGTRTDGDAVRLHLHALSTRIARVESAASGHDPLPGARGAAVAVRRVLGDVGPSLARADALEPAALRAVVTRLDALSPALDQLHGNAYVQADHEQANREAQLGIIGNQVALSAAGILAAGTFLVVMLLSEGRRAGEALRLARAAEERVGVAVGGSSDGLWDCTDLETGRSWWSPRYYELLGLEPGTVEPNSNAYFERVHPEDREALLAARTRHLEHGEPYDVEQRVRLASGEYRWFRTRAKAVRDAAGNPVRLAGSIQDVHDRKSAEAALALRNRALESAANGVIITDQRRADQPVVYCNPAFERMSGYAEAEVIGRNMRLLQGDERDQDVLAELRLAIEEGREFRGILRNHRKDGTLFWNDLRLSPVADEHGEVTHYVGIQTDVTEAQNLAEQLSYQASHDSLTGLVNRREFERRLADAHADARAKGRDHAVCYLDLDQFKIINDTHGHVAGDELLRQLGTLLQRRVRRQDTIGRLGGDEFGVLLPHCGLSDAMAVADAMREAIAEYRFPWSGRTFRIGVSIGLVPITPFTAGVDDVLKAADAACYAAKDEGRNRIHVYHEDDKQIARRHGEMMWVSRIQDALDNDGFRLYAQPIAPLGASGAEVTDYYEVLLRLEGEDGRIVTPGSFLPAAERYGLSPRVDRWVVGTVFDRLAEMGVGGPPTVCAVNLSGATLGDREFLAFVMERLAVTGVDPSCLCFEITETAAITNLSSAMHLISSLREIGCRFALDDFGSGFSSFGYLKTLPVDTLKIDGLFVRDVVDDPFDRTMVRSICELARVLGMRTVAEFVETPRVLEEVRRIGVDYGQGYAIGRPRRLESVIGANAAEHLREAATA